MKRRPKREQQRGRRERRKKWTAKVRVEVAPGGTVVASSKDVLEPRVDWTDPTKDSPSGVGCANREVV